MSALLALLLANPWVVAILGALGGMAAAFWRGRRAGVASERAKAEREADRAHEAERAVEDAIAGRAPADNRERLGKWGK